MPCDVITCKGLADEESVDLSISQVDRSSQYPGCCFVDERYM